MAIEKKIINMNKYFGQTKQRVNKQRRRKRATKILKIS